MKKLFSILLLAFLVTYLNAADVDCVRAKVVASNFWEITTGTPSSLSNFTESFRFTASISSSRSDEEHPVLYVFNHLSGNGFVIVAGDDAVQPILAYSTEGTLSQAQLPPPVQMWLSGYKEQIAATKASAATADSEIEFLWNSYYNNTPTQSVSRSQQAVNPLCQTKWNQSPYENQLCPYDNQYNERTVTGCVATAMAQIMKYWNYPATGTGFHSYNDNNYGTLSANYGSTTYQWNQMPNTVNSANNAVATLMFHCGVGVDMNYGVAATGGSAAYVISAASPIQACAEYAYKTYFGYDGSLMQGVQRQNFNDANWKAKLKTDLDAGRPIQYAGFGSGGGHTWVCDGYDQNDFFHMNWGWAGNSDGFFSLNNLSPGSLGAGGGTGGFNSGQQALVGIKPLNGGGGGGGGGTVNPTGISLYSQITVNSNPIQTRSSLTVNTQIANLGASNITVDLAAALFNSDGIFVDFIQQYSSQTLNAGFYYNVPFSIADLNVIPGLYYVGIYYKSGSNNYTLVDPASYNNPVTITVTGPPNNIQMYSNTTVNPAVIVKGQSFTTNNQIANMGGSNFTGYLSADVFTLDGDYVITIDEFALTMNAGFYYDIQFASNGLNIPAGTYYIAYFSSPDATNWTLVYGASYPNPIKVTIVDPTLSPDMYEVNNTAAAAYSLPINFSGNNATVLTTGSNVHVGNDYDYYKVVLPSGNNYSITARVHDSYSSGNGNTYTNDVQVSYSIDGGAQSSAYDDLLGNAIYVPGGGTVTFFVSDYFSGTTGTYLLDLRIARGPNVGIDEIAATSLHLFPNPAHNLFSVKLPSTGSFDLLVYDAIGKVVCEKHSDGIVDSILSTDVSNLPVGMYTVKFKTVDVTYTSKLLLQ